MKKRNAAAQRCPYCGLPFHVEPKHTAHRLLPWCSYGCKLAVEAPLTHAGHSFVSLDADPPATYAATAAPEPEPTMPEAGPLIAWLETWLRMPPPTRDAVALRIVCRDRSMGELAAVLHCRTRQRFNIRLREAARGPMAMIAKLLAVRHSRPSV